ncbi:MAG TPA: hypothetical protein DCL35_01765 [Candidatus Omnitrophica bacterium]|nr:hypothetical protein [Candidatus Omnitrophota bacterium]
MRKTVFAALALVVLAGCSTTRGTGASIENRVQALENRIQVLESDVQTQGASGYSSDVFTSKPVSDVAAETMSKKQIQQALKNAGYYDGTIDGKIGPRTKEAIKEFQKSSGLYVDGVAGRKTKENLLRYL